MANLFTSSDWHARIRQLHMDQNSWNLIRLWGLRILRPPFAELTDYEKWPDPSSYEASQSHADVLVFRKLLQQSKPSELPQGSVFWQESSTFQIDLQKSIHVKKEVLSHLGRTERKLQSEWGAVEIVEATDLTKHAWYAQWRHHLSRRYPKSPLIDLHNQTLLRKWILDLPLAPWMKLVSLRVGEHSLAWALVTLGVASFIRLRRS